jgi:hypothetical protein
VSPNGYQFPAWPQLCADIAASARTDSAVLDGQIVCLDDDGRPNFNALLLRRAAPWFVAFDVLRVWGVWVGATFDRCPCANVNRFSGIWCLGAGACKFSSLWRVTAWRSIVQRASGTYRAGSPNGRTARIRVAGVVRRG